MLLNVARETSHNSVERYLETKKLEAQTKRILRRKNTDILEIFVNLYSEISLSKRYGA